MAKANFHETAKSLKNSINDLVVMIGNAQTEVGSLLANARGLEKSMKEKQAELERERKEKEREEKLRSLFEQNAGGAYVGGEEGETAGETPPEETVKAEPAHAEPMKQEASKPETPKADDGKADPEKGAEPAEKPAKTSSADREGKTSAPENRGFEAHVINKEDDRPRRERPQGDANRNASGDRPQGGYNRNASGDRPQGGYGRNASGERPQGGFNRNASGDRPQGGYNRNASGDRPQGGFNRGQQGGFNRGPQGGMTRNGAANASAIPQADGKNRSGAYDQNRNKNTAKSYDTDKKTKNKKAMQREAGPDARNWDEESPTGSRRPKHGQKQQTAARKPEPVVIEKAVITSETISVKDLSEKIGKPVTEIIKKLFMLGIMATINQEIDFDTCELVCSDFNIELEYKPEKSAEDLLNDASAEEDTPETLSTRPPVVTIMGHVDHGKTSLLDAIRESSVTAGEAGGITQHIGAYTVMCNSRQITFIDTPGHEAFTSMRARGAQVTDIVILVVAADDGIMPQTVEAINHAKAANVPIIVAINKMDKPEANPDRVMQQLTEYELVPEEWGGETICVPVSAKSRMNLDTLLEMVLLQADVLELKANANRLAKGTIIEARLDKGRGPIATVLVQNGTLKRGDTIIAGTAFGRVRAMMDDKGRTVAEAGPSTPVEVLGFNEVPEAGDVLTAADADKLTRQVAEERLDKIKAARIKSQQKVSLDDLFSQMAEGELKTLNIIVKADVQGSVEAVRQALEKLSNEEVRVKCIHGGVGAINGSDVVFASASNAIIIGFNVRPDSAARAAAEHENVDIRTYRVIYNAIEDVENAMKGLFKPVYHEVELGRISVRETFRISGVGTIAGAYVQDGKVTRTAQVRVVRDGIVLHEGKISSLKRFKDDAKEVLAGYECGIGIENFNDLLEGDVIEAYITEEVKR